MSIIYHFEPDHYKNRWVVYLDILGFGDYVLDNDYSKTFILLSKIIDYIKNDTDYENKEHSYKYQGASFVNFTWFSDSFVIYTEESDGPDETSSSSIWHFDSAIRRILDYMTEQRIPFRGALAYGELYADKENNIFFGKALLEAHEYGEAQDWIGFIACPSAVEQARTLGFNFNSYPLSHRKWNIPYKENVSEKLEKILPAYLIALNGKRAKSAVIFELETARNTCDDEKTKTKYKRTIDFMEEAMIVDTGIA